jgi:asparagine synthase (glutamine-hydrolysing)
MCGIVGVLSKNRDNNLSQIVKKMLATMGHRGPNGTGIFENEKLVLAMKRLAIIDIQGGNQPIFNEDKSIAIVANGEIYNYLEIQKTLLKKNHNFSSKGDIETLVHLFEEKGIKLLDDLIGMFAFALFDVKQNVVYLARDRYGEKPLYYTLNEKGLFFSSELKTMLEVPNINRKFNQKAIKEFFYYNYIPEPNTMFDSIKKVPAGHYLRIDLNNFNFSLKRYWDFKSINPVNESDPENLIKENLYKACERCLRSDVPVGISLSGGIDSSAILAICSQKSKKNLTAFSIGYEEKSSNDESKFAESFSKKMGVNYIRKKISTNDFVQFFPSLIYWSDEPIADLAAFSIYSVAKIAKENNVPVLLGGLGGDELFWGYPSFNKITRDNETILPINNFNLFHQDRVYNRAKTIMPFLLTETYKNIVLGDDAVKVEIVDDIQLAKQALNDLRNVWLVSNCLALNDRLSMAASIESRVPLLDFNLSKIALESKKNLLGYKMDPKHYLKKSLKNILPEEVLTRPKRGFTPPSYYWLKEIISKYIFLLEDGFLVKEGILKMNRIKILILTWPVYSIFWDNIYKLILLEIWGREYCYGLKPEEIKELVKD